METSVPLTTPATADAQHPFLAQADTPCAAGTGSGSGRQDETGEVAGTRVLYGDLRGRAINRWMAYQR